VNVTKPPESFHDLGIATFGSKSDGLRHDLWLY